jgi:putative tricarboxylic transport membrane protein
MGEKKLEFSGSQKTSLISGFVTIGVGAVYLIMSMALPRAAVGMPQAPKVFPIGLSVLMLALGVALVVQQYLAALQKRKTEGPSAVGRQTVAKAKVTAAGAAKTKEKGRLEDHTKKIILTVANGVLYALLFRPIGYVLSTIVFLGLELLLFSGLKRWKMILTVSLIFSVFVYVLFSTVLGVYLPRMPILGL